MVGANIKKSGVKHIITQIIENNRERYSPAPNLKSQNRGTWEGLMSDEIHGFTNYSLNNEREEESQNTPDS
jgi:hypothetical protein